MNSLLKKLWYSPVVASWGSIGVRGLNTVLVLPLALSIFNQEEINLYLLFIVYFSIKDVFDLGFLNNTARFYTYTLSGVTNLRKLNNGDGKLNEILFNSLHKVSGKIYFLVSTIFLVLMSSVGTLTINETLNSIDLYGIYFVWWGQVLLTAYVLYGNKYISVIIGFDKIDLLKKWDAFIVLLQVLTSVLILLITKDINLFIINQSVWYFIITLRNRSIAQNLFDSLRIDTSNINNLYEKYVLKILFKRSAQSFAAGLFGYGIDQFTRIFYGNVGEPKSSSSYLLTMKLLDQVKQISRPPFYAKIPYLSKLASASEKHKFYYKKTITFLVFSMIIFLIGSGVIYVFSDYIIDILGSETQFVSNQVWIALIIALTIERFTAMLSQSIMIKRNKVIAHEGLFTSGLIYMAMMFWLFPNYGLIALPISLGFSYLFFYTMYSIYLNIKDYKSSK